MLSRFLLPNPNLSPNELNVDQEDLSLDDMDSSMSIHPKDEDSCFVKKLENNDHCWWDYDFSFVFMCMGLAYLWSK